MRIRRAVACIVAATLTTTAVGLVGAAVASANATRALALGRFADMLVEHEHGHLFLSGSTSGISVTGHAGIYVGAPDGTNLHDVLSDPDASAGAMTESPDGSTVYATGDKAIYAIDTATLAVTTHSLTDIGCLGDIAATTGQVWFAYSCDGTGSQVPINLAVLDTASGVVTSGVAPHTLESFVRLESVPGRANLLAIGESNGGDTPAPLITLETASGQTLAELDHLVPSAEQGAHTFALNADGSRLLVARNYSTAEYLTGDLTQPVRVFSTPQGAPVSVGFSADSATVAVTASYSWATDNSYSGYGGAASTFREDTGKLVRTYDYRMGFTQEDVINDATPYSLDWNGNTLLVVYHNYIDERPTLHVLSNALHAPVKVTVAAPAKATRAKSLTLTGTVRSMRAGLAGARVYLTRHDLAGNHSLGSTTTSATGGFTFHDRPTVGGTVTYRVTYRGDALHTAAAGADATSVSRVTPALSLRSDRSTFTYGQSAALTTHLGRTYNSRTVSVYAAVYPNKPKLLRAAKVDRSGDLRISFTMHSRTVFQVRFAGDYRYAPRTASVVARVRAKLGTSISRWYTKDGKYYVFHESKGGVIRATVHPASLDLVTFQLQVYYQGRWQDIVVQSFQLDGRGRSGPITFHARSGYKFRIRAFTYPRMYNGVTTTLGAAQGPWWYCRFR